MIILIAGYFVLGTSTTAYCFVGAGLTVMGVVGNAMHMSFHIRNFELEKYEWYMELRTLHYIHHLGDMKSNLAMVNMGMDGLFNSLQVDDPLRNTKKFEKMPEAPGLKRSQSLSLDKIEDLPEGMTNEMVDRIRDAAGI